MANTVYDDLFDKTKQKIDSMNDIITFIEMQIESFSTEQMNQIKEIFPQSGIELDYEQTLENGTLIATPKADSQDVLQNLIAFGKAMERSNIFLEKIVKTKFLYEPVLSKSIIISEYSILEVCLNELCDLCKEEKNKSKRFTEIEGQGIERAARYLKKIIGINEINTHNSWSVLTKWGKARNCLVHNNGIPKSDDSNVIADVLSINSAGYIITSFVDCKKLGIAINNYIDNIRTLFG